MSEQANHNILEITAQIVASHLSNNPVETSKLPALIQSVYRTLCSVDVPEPTPVIAQTPAVPIKKSVFPNFIVCLEDGKKRKTLKSHLRASYGLTPEAYRAKWGLPLDYPMVAPNYAAKRSDLAKSMGLGRKPSAETSEPEAAQPDKQEVTMAPARRARGSKG